MTYTPKLIAFLQRHWNKDVSGPRLAQLIGTSYKNLKQSVHRLRGQGYEFASNKAPIGHTRLHPRSNGKGFDMRIKTAEGFKYVPVEVKKTRTRNNAPVKPKKPRKVSPHPRPQKPVIKTPDGKASIPKGRNPTKNTRTRQPVTNDSNPAEVVVKEQTGGRWVRVNEKTIVYRKTA